MHEERFLFHYSKNHQETSGFLTLSGRIKREIFLFPYAVHIWEYIKIRFYMLEFLELK